MKRIYKKHTEWECYNNGMYSTPSCDDLELINNSIEMFKSDEWFYNTSLKVMNEWKVSTDVNLSNTSHNRQSWIGQSACCFLFGATEITSRKTWALLDTETQRKANLVADKIIRIYERGNKKVHSDMGTELLF